MQNVIFLLEKIECIMLFLYVVGMKPDHLISMYFLDHTLERLQTSDSYAKYVVYQQPIYNSNLTMYLI